MAEEKRYYWIKLKTDFFDLETIDWLRSQENGCEYIVLYQQLCLMTANKDGEMASRIGEMIVPFDAKKIARDTKTDIDTVLVAMELFARIGLILLQENGIFRIPALSEMVGSETGAAERMRKSRKRNNVTPELQQCYTELEKENRVKILDSELEPEGEKDSSSTTTGAELWQNRLEAVIKHHWKREATEQDIKNALQYVTDDDSFQMLANALELSGRREEAANWAYVRAIYDSWKRNGITNDLELIQHEIARRDGLK